MYSILFYSLDESNYETMIIPEKIKKFKDTFRNKHDKKKTIVYDLTNQPPYSIGRQRKTDVAKGRPGTVPEATREIPVNLLMHFICFSLNVCL